MNYTTKFLLLMMSVSMFSGVWAMIPAQRCGATKSHVAEFRYYTEELQNSGDAHCTPLDLRIELWPESMDGGHTGDAEIIRQNPIAGDIHLSKDQELFLQFKVWTLGLQKIVCPSQFFVTRGFYALLAQLVAMKKQRGMLNDIPATLVISDIIGFQYQSVDGIAIRPRAVLLHSAPPGPVELTDQLKEEFLRGIRVHKLVEIDITSDFIVSPEFRAVVDAACAANKLALEAQVRS